MAIATLEKATIIVQRTHKFGILGMDDIWYGTKKPLTVADFEVGGTYEVLLEPYIAKSGTTGHNIAQVIGTEKPEEGAKKASVKKAAYVKPKYEARDFQAEARGKVTSNAYNSPLLPTLVQFAGDDYDAFMKLVDKTVKHISKKVWESQET